jgi:hypothetical protein
MSSREKSHHRRHSSPTCNSDHSDHSDHSNYSDEIELYSNKHKRDHVNKDLKIEITSRCHSRSSDSSSSRSSSPSSSYERKCKKNSHKKDSYKKNSHKKDSHKKECSDSDHQDKCSFEEIYKYYKYRMLHDKELMVTGSTSYLCMNNNEIVTIPKNYEVKLNNVSLKKNIDLGYVNVPYYVREEGVYILFFVINSNQSSQFAFYVNGLEQPLTRYGNNAGAGQLILRTLLKLKKNDAVVIRNSRSSAATVSADLYIGGILPGNNLTYLMMKIAPYCQPKCEEWDDKHLSKRKLYLFKKLLDKLLLDKDLMLKGFDIHGTFHRSNGVIVPTNTDVPFEATTNVNGLSWSSVVPEKVNILEDGVYKVFFLANTTSAAQLAFFVNGIAIETTTQGINMGAAQVSLRALLELKKGDMLTVRNHTSTNGSIEIPQKTGGKQNDVDAILTVMRIAPLVQPIIDECKLNDYHKKYYCKFKQYLLNQKCLQITGSNSYWNVTSDTKQILHASESLDWSNTVLQENIWHYQGSPKFTIMEDGIYDLFADLTSNQPAQWCVFVNGTADLTTCFGRDSGGARTLLRQFVKLNKGDVVTVRNYEANSDVIETSTNAGGELVGQSVVFMAFKLSPITECVPCLPHHPHHPPHPPKCDSKDKSKR